ncbi:MAG: MFS transporter [Acidimicrobiia bacterium]
MAVRRRVWAHPNYQKFLLLTCLSGMFATSFTATIMAVSIRTVATDLGSTPGVVAWVLTAPGLAAAVAMPILGRLGDIRGHRRVYMIGFGIAIGFNVATALAWNATSLIVVRTIAQLAGTATVPASFAMLFKQFPPEERMKASAWSSGVLSGASVTGLAIGGPLIDWAGWRPLFYVQALLCAVAFVAAIFVLQPDVVHREISIDKAGAAALAVTAFALTFGVNRAAAWNMLHPVVLAMVVLFPLAAWSLVLIERKARDPVLPVQMVKMRNVRVVTASSFLVGIAWMGNFLVTPLLLQTIFGLSATKTSFITVVRTLSISLSAPIANYMGSRFGVRRVALISGSIVMCAIGGLAAGAASKSLIVVIASLFATGASWGHFQPSLIAMIGNSVDSINLGLATSLQQTANSIGSVTGSGLMTALAADAVTRGPYVTSYLIAAVVGAIGVLALLGSRSRTAEQFEFAA